MRIQPLLRAACVAWLSLICLSAPGGPLLAAEPDVAIRQVSADVGKHAAWMADAEKCPVQVMQRREIPSPVKEEHCKARPGDCLSKCESSDGGACYWLAYALQQGGASSKVSESLFQRACSLGVMSGCTNRAAGMAYGKPDDPRTQTCALETYTKVCNFDDPWACTMQAFHLVRGIGVKQDFDLALQVMKKSCKYGEGDPACSGARKLTNEIAQARENAPSVK